MLAVAPVDHQSSPFEYTSSTASAGCIRECRESELGPEAKRNDRTCNVVSATRLIFTFSLIHFNLLVPQITLQARLERQRGPRGLPHGPKVSSAARNESSPPARNNVEIRRRQRPGQDGCPTNGTIGQETKNGHDNGHETRTTNYDASLYALYVGKSAQYVFHQCDNHGYSQSPLGDLFNGHSV